MSDLSPILAIVFLIVLAGGLAYAFWHAHKTEQRRQADYRAFAQRRGLSFEFRPARHRQPAELRFAQTDGGASLIVTRSHSKKSGNSTTRVAGHSVVRLPDPRMPGGMAVYAPPMAKGLAASASVLLGALDNGLARMILGKLLGDEIGAHLGQLRDFPAPSGTDLTILASVDPTPMFDSTAIATAIDAAPTGRNAEGKTMVLLTETGLQLRVARDLNEAPEIEALLDAALTLAQALRR